MTDNGREDDPFDVDAYSDDVLRAACHKIVERYVQAPIQTYQWYDTQHSMSELVAAVHQAHSERPTP